MNSHAAGEFEVKSWNEEVFSEVEGGPKLARAGVKSAFRGDVEGESTLEYLMIYNADGTAGFVGAEQVTGSIGGRTGSFVLQHSGKWENDTATGSWSVVTGSGTGGLAGLRGEGWFAAPSGQKASYTLDYEFT